MRTDAVSVATIQCPSCLREVTQNAGACPICAEDLSPLIMLRLVMDRLSPASASDEAQAGEASQAKDR